MSVAVLAPVLLAFLSQQDAAAVNEDILLLSRARLQMSNALKRMPNYTCLETIERSKRLVKRRKFELIDVLRLEVGMVEGKELFAWPGSGKFEDKDLTDMVPAGGAIGNGSFGSHATSIFRSGVASITFGGREGKSVRYDYRVPQNLSGYKLRSGKDAEAIIGYHGSFLVDPETSRVTHIEVVGDDIPIFLEVLGTEATIDYGMVAIGGQDYWLPTGSSMKITSLDSSEFRNEIQFTGCRQFSGESTLSFEDAPADTTPALPGDELVVVPKDKLISVDLVTPVKWGTSKTGDLVEAILTTDLKHKGALLFPKGSKVTGRIARFQSGGDTGQIVEIAFESIANGNRHAPFKAALFDRAGNAGTLVRQPTRLTRNSSGVPMGIRDRPGVVMVWSYNTNVRLDKGFRTTWTTLE